jgi:hypothetical protein
MNKHLTHLFLALVFPLLLLAACGRIPTINTSNLSQETIAAMAAETMQAIQTRDALLYSPTPSPLPPTNTPLPTATLASTRTPLPTATPFPTLTPAPSATPGPSATVTIATATSQFSGSGSGSGGTGGSGGSGSAATPSICNWAALLKDVTIPDGTVVSPGSLFTKVWRVRNIGTCTWTTKYQLQFVDGDDMDSRSKIPLPEKVAPGETIDLAVDLTAPKDAGDYSASYLLSDGSKRFGIGSSAKGPLTVDIQVNKPDKDVNYTVGYDFVLNYCAAQWESGSGNLPCPGDEGDADGFVVRLSNPELENRHENEPALWTHPDQVHDGWISGTYPPYTVQKGDHFVTDIGCLAGFPKCDVIFRLKYINPEGKEKMYAEWPESYDGEITRVDIGLENLEGKKVQFILYVDTNGNYRDDAAFWLVPQIRR